MRRVFIILIVFFWFKLNFLDIVVKYIFVSEISDVILVIVNDKKNKILNNGDIGNLLIIWGNIMNVSLMLVFVILLIGIFILFVINLRVVKILIFVNNLNFEFVNLVIKVLFVVFEFFGK